MAPETRHAPRTPVKKNKGGRPRKLAIIAPTKRSPNTERLCTRARELAAKHVPGTDLCPSSRSLLIQLRGAIKAKKACEFTKVGQLESLFKIRQGYISELATRQSHTGMITTIALSGSPAEHWDDGDWFNRMVAALLKGRKVHKGTGLTFLTQQLGMGKEWSGRAATVSTRVRKSCQKLDSKRLLKQLYVCPIYTTCFQPYHPKHDAIAHWSLP